MYELAIIFLFIFYYFIYSKVNEYDNREKKLHFQTGYVNPIVL